MLSLCARYTTQKYVEKYGYSSDVYNGKGAVYKKTELKARWCPGGTDGWGRIFDQDPK